MDEIWRLYLSYQCLSVESISVIFQEEKAAPAINAKATESLKSPDQCNTDNENNDTVINNKDEQQNQ